MTPNDLQKLNQRLKLDSKKWEESIYGPYYKTILLFITNKCNLRCKTCFNKNNLDGHSEMSFEYIKTIVDNNPDVEKYDIMGGEPLLHKELDKILSYLEKMNKKIGLYTNGMFLDNLKKTYRNLKLNMAFHSIHSLNPYLKPIDMVADKIKRFQDVYPIKLCYLMSSDNYDDLKFFAQYIEDNFKNIKKLTIGALRDESDYWSDDSPDIMPLKDYYSVIQNFLDTYDGKLNVDIFTEGVIFTPNLPKSQPNQINRFKCVFVDNKYAECLYDIGIDKKISFDPNKPINFCDYKKCPRYGRENCLTDKIKLIKI